MKAQMQFNWIFVIVVGAIILLFFTGFIIKYKQLQDKKIEIIFLNNFDKALTNLQSSGFKTSTNINLPLDVNIGCDNIYINEKHETINLFFSPNKLKYKLYIWYYPYEFPFKVDNFYFLIDNFGIKIQTNNQALINELIEDMPEDFKNRISIVNSGGKIINIQGDINNGYVTINNQQYPYYGKALLYGAIFSDNYDCLLNKVNLRFNEVINSYQRKIGILMRTGCNYNLINQKLNDLKMNKNYELINELEELNRNLASLDCPVVF